MKGILKIGVGIFLIVIFVVVFFYPKSISKVQNGGEKLIQEESQKLMASENTRSFLEKLQENFHNRCQESIEEIFSDKSFHSILGRGWNFSLKLFENSKQWVKGFDIPWGTD